MAVWRINCKLSSFFFSFAEVEDEWSLIQAVDRVKLIQEEHQKKAKMAESKKKMREELNCQVYIINIDFGEVAVYWEEEKVYWREKRKNSSFSLVAWEREKTNLYNFSSSKKRSARRRRKNENRERLLKSKVSKTSSLFFLLFICMILHSLFFYYSQSNFELETRGKETRRRSQETQF